MTQDIPKSAIGTHSGIMFDPLNPNPNLIDIEDIAHALSLLCRFGGHCDFFYSVAQHSILMSEQIPEPHKLWALLHDVTEAYVPDVCGPVKPFIQGFKEIENKLEEAIATKFHLNPVKPDPIIKDYDRRMLHTEFNQIKPNDKRDRSDLPQAFDITLESWSPDVAKQRFLDQFHILTAQQKTA